MKKLYTTALSYMIAALCGGVFYREFTKFNGFTGKTTLGVVHAHLLLLGMFFFLLLLLLEKAFSLTSHKSFGKFYCVYNAGVILTAVMFLVRGIPQVLALPLSNGLSAAISGVAGIGHLLVTIGLAFFFLILKKCALSQSAKV